jgi:hypothetical protein
VTSIYRFIEIGDYGRFWTRDDITFANTGDVPVQSFYICLNETEASQMYDMVVFNYDNLMLPVTPLAYRLNGYIAYRIDFPDPLLTGEQIKFQVWQYFQNNVQFSLINGDQDFQYYHSIFTIVPYVTDFIKTEIILPAQSALIDHTPTNYGPTPASTGPIIYESVLSDPFNFAVAYVHFTNLYTNYVQSLSFSTVIKVSSLTAWTVSASTVVDNLGKNVLSDLIFTVPADAYNFTAKDNIGDIMLTPQASLTPPTGSFWNISVPLMTGNRYQIPSGGKMDITFSFRLPMTNRILVGDLSNLVLVDLYRTCSMPWLLENYQVVVVLPASAGIDFSKLNIFPTSVDNTAGNQELTYANEGASGQSATILTVMYTYSAADMQARPLLLALLAGIITSMAVLLRKASMRYKSTEIGGPVYAPELPVDMLKEFCATFVEKIALYIQFDQLNEDFKQRKIKKREFTLQVDDFTRNLRNLDDQIKVSKRRLTETGGRFKEIIEEFDVLEAERQTVQDALGALERNYKEGKIKSRVAFEKLYDNYETRLKKIQSSLDSGIQELKNYYL